jgi:hypothetical protein
LWRSRCAVVKGAAVEVRTRSANGIFYGQRSNAARESNLDAESLATLGTSSSEHQAAPARRHAGTKSMSALAVQVAGLIRALHDRVSVWSLRKKMASKQCHVEGTFEGREGYAPMFGVSSQNRMWSVDKYFCACG